MSPHFVAEKPLTQRGYIIIPAHSTDKFGKKLESELKRCEKPCLPRHRVVLIHLIPKANKNLRVLCILQQYFAPALKNHDCWRLSLKIHLTLALKIGYVFLYFSNLTSIPVVHEFGASQTLRNLRVPEDLVKGGL